VLHVLAALLGVVIAAFIVWNHQRRERARMQRVSEAWDAWVPVQHAEPIAPPRIGGPPR
jgi:hypothetical protein